MVFTFTLCTYADGIPSDYTPLKGLKCNKAGNITDNEGTIVGRLVEGNVEDCAGRAADEQGKFYNDSGKVIGQGEPLPEEERKKSKIQPFEDFPGATVQKDGSVLFEGRQVGVVVEGDPKKLEGKQVDADGDIRLVSSRGAHHVHTLTDSTATRMATPSVVPSVTKRRSPRRSRSTTLSSRARLSTRPATLSMTVA